MNRIKEIRVAYTAPQGMMIIKETLGPRVRCIEYDPNFPGFTLHIFNAANGQMDKKNLNLASCVWFEYDIEDHPDSSS